MGLSGFAEGAAAAEGLLNRAIASELSILAKDGRLDHRIVADVDRTD
jgi:hypothetical protein